MRLADFIQENLELILREWEQFAREIWPETGPVDPAELRDHAAEMLLAIAADMGSPQSGSERSDKSRGLGRGGSTSDTVDRASVLHGGGRHQTGFELPAVIAEYRALRASVVRLWHEIAPEPSGTALDDLTRFHEGIDQSLAQAVMEFTRRHDDERRAGETLLREHQDRFWTLANAAPALLWVTEPDGHCSFLSQAWYDYTGQTEAEGLGKGWLDAVHPDDRPRAAQSFLDASRERREFVLDYRLRRADGEYRWCIDTGRPRFDSSGACTGFVGSVIDAHERRAAEEALRASQARLSLAQSAGRVGVFEWFIPENRIIWSPELEELYGLAPGEFPGMLEGWNRLVVPEDANRVLDEIEVCLKRRAEEYAYEFRAILPSGGHRWLAGQARFIYAPDGAPLRMIGVNIDIHDRKVVEGAQRESEYRYRTMFNSIDQGFCILELIVDAAGRPADYRIMEANPAFSRLTGLNSMDGKTVLELLPDLEFSWVETYGKVALTGTPVQFENFAAPLGKWYQVYAFRFGAPEKRQVGVLFSDITAGRAAQAEMNLLKAAIEAANDSVIITESLLDYPGPRIEYVNPAFTALTGYAAQEVIGKTPRLLQGPLTDRSLLDRLRRDLNSMQSFQGETINYRKDGTTYSVEWRIAPLRDQQGTVSKWVAVQRDVTERRRTEDELARHREHLERLVAERTAQLEESHRHLRLTERMAALGTLSAGLGHDMGNMLVPVRVRLETLAHAELPAALKEDVEALQRSAEYLRRLASGLRALALDPHARSTREVTDLNAWWEDTEQLLRSVLPGGVALHGDFAQGDVRVRMSKPALTQAVFNLVQNAGDALRSTGVGRVTVWTKATNGTVRIGVTDDGPGMTPEVKARCMEPFFSTKPRDISTGMGLSLVYSLVMESNGRIEVHSAPGEGTTFVVILPVALEGEHPGHHGSMPRGTATLMISDARLRAIMSAELRHLGFEISAAGDTGADVLLLDNTARIDDCPASKPTLLLGQDIAAPREGVITLGARPTLKAIRSALRELAARHTALRNVGAPLNHGVQNATKDRVDTQQVSQT